LLLARSSECAVISPPDLDAEVGDQSGVDVLQEPTQR
jgi:hypothetical protein